MPEKTKPTTEKPVDTKTAAFRAANPPPVPASGEALKQNKEKAAALEAEAEQSGGPLTLDVVVDSVQLTGNGRDTFTVVLRPDENDTKFFRRASGRIELNDVRPEFGKQLQGKARATVTIAVTA